MWLGSHLNDEELEGLGIAWDGELAYAKSRGTDAFQSGFEAMISLERKKKLFALVEFAQRLRLILELTSDLSRKAESGGLVAL